MSYGNKTKIRNMEIKMDIVERLNDDSQCFCSIRKEAADYIARLREEVQELEQIMEENNCAVGFLITKRALKQNGAWKQKDSES